MTTSDGVKLIVVNFNEPMTGDWNIDKKVVEKLAMQSTSAERFFDHATAVEGVIQNLTYGTPAASAFPRRTGMLRQVHDELYPIGHFSKLFFSSSPDVFIKWQSGNQNFDATVEDRREDSLRSSIRYLEVTTLQDGDDAAELIRLSTVVGPTTIPGDSEALSHARKVKLLSEALEKKAKKKYPENTALLVYTDEERFKRFHYGPPRPAIDKRADFVAVLNKMKSDLKGFSHVFVYGKGEIYCMIPC